MHWGATGLPYLQDRSPTNERRVVNCIEREPSLVEAIDEIETAFPSLESAFVHAFDEVGLFVDKDFLPFALALARTRALLIDRFLWRVRVDVFVLVEDLEPGVKQVPAQEGRCPALA